MRWNGDVVRKGESYIQDFGEKTLRKRNHLGDPGVYGRIILRWG
jgi:hypothetical protein